MTNTEENKVNGMETEENVIEFDEAQKEAIKEEVAKVNDNISFEIDDETRSKLAQMMALYGMPHEKDFIKFIIKYWYSIIIAPVINNNRMKLIELAQNNQLLKRDFKQSALYKGLVGEKIGLDHEVLDDLLVPADELINAWSEKDKNEQEEGPVPTETVPDEE